MPFISEVLPNPKGSDRGAEWIELGNDGPAPAALSGWTLKDASGKVFQLRGEVSQDGFLVVSGTDLGLSLNNGEETLTLLDPAGSVRDVVSWTAAPEGESFVRSGTAFLWTARPTPGEANRVESTMFEDRIALKEEGLLASSGGMGAALGLSLIAGLAAVFLAQYFFRHLNDNEAR
ncbi:MAG: lamin tail domain-containing protein [Candidatus Liptonbacteria bacterium]|nr:lamin tail domain-containing protein [Candidatus Liptonbacteria bacterium]